MPFPIGGPLEQSL